MRHAPLTSRSRASRSRTARPVVGGLFVLLASLLVAPGCGPRLADPHLPRAAAADLLGQAAVLRRHDDHFHHAECGHAARYHDGRWVYYYRGHWEYYDPGTGRWFAYRS